MCREANSQMNSLNQKIKQIETQKQKRISDQLIIYAEKMNSPYSQYFLRAIGKINS